jgi:hypothetical protein
MITMLAHTTDLAQKDPVRLVRPSSASKELDFQVDTDHVSHVTDLTSRKPCCNSPPIFPSLPRSRDDDDDDDQLDDGNRYGEKERRKFLR